MCFCAVNCYLNCYLSLDLPALPVIRKDVDSGRGGEVIVLSCFVLFLTFGIGLYICAVVLFLRLGVVFDFHCAIASAVLLASFMLLALLTMLPAANSFV